MEQFLLKWNNHQTNFVDVFGQLYEQEAFTDVTLAVDGRTFEAHKIVLSACSPYLRHILSQNPCRHPVVFLRGVAASELHTLLQYIYRGEAHVRQDKLPELLRTATELQIKGLSSVSDGMSNPPTTGFPSPPLSTPSKNSVAALDMSSPPRVSAFDSLRSPLFSKLGRTAADRESATSLSASDETTADFDKTSEQNKQSSIAEPPVPPLLGVIKNEGDETQSASALDASGSEDLTGGPPALSESLDPCSSSASSAARSNDNLLDNEYLQNIMSQLAPLRQHSSTTATPTVRKGPYSCRYCGETFKAKEHLNRHERIHTGERPFPCSLCEKRFSRKDHLKIHLLIHTGEKPFHCTMCNKRFTQKQTLIEHENVHLGRKPFHCDMCNASFPARGNLKYHRRSVHGCTLTLPARSATPQQQLQQHQSDELTALSSTPSSSQTASHHQSTASDA